MQKKIAISLRTGIEFIKLEDIYYCKAMDNYTILYLENDKKVVCKSLKNFQEPLENNGFFRVSRSYLVNLKYIKSLILGKKSSVRLENDINIILSRNNKKKFIDTIYQNSIIHV